MQVCLMCSYMCIIYFQEEELRSIQLQEKVDELQEEKERILNSLVEAE